MDAPLDALDEAARHAIVYDVLHLDSPDAATLSSALSIANTLRNPRDEWQARIAA